jgi:predicted dehydrogenase
VSPSAKVRWGILGVAKINERLLPAWGRSRHAELRAIASRSLARAQSAARTAGIPVAHGSYEALLDDPTIDVVYNPLPNTLHCEWTMKAADRGKHILCEKPLAPTAAEAEQIVEYCRAKKVCLMDGFMWPHHPRTARIRQLLDAGHIGAVQRAVSAFTFAMNPSDTGNIRLQANLGGGSLLDVGCYPVYGIRWAFGAEPARVYATAEFRNGVDVSMQALLWFADGRTASFDCGFTMPYRGWLEITGTTGVVRVPGMWLPPRRAVFETHRDGLPIAETIVEGEDQIERMIDNFSQNIRDGTPVHPSPDEAVRTLRVLDALARSARENRLVEV